MAFFASYQFWIYYFVSTIFAFWFIEKKYTFSKVGAKLKAAFLLCLPAFLLVAVVRKALTKYIALLLK